MASHATSAIPARTGTAEAYPARGGKKMTPTTSTTPARAIQIAGGRRPALRSARTIGITQPLFATCRRPPPRRSRADDERRGTDSKVLGEALQQRPEVLSLAGRPHHHAARGLREDAQHLPVGFAHA